MRRWRSRVLLTAILAASMCAGVAVASWTTTGSGTASGTVGTLTPPAISVPSSSSGSHTVTFTQQATVTGSTDESEIAYTVERKLGSGSFEEITSGGCDGPLPHGTTTCTDTVAASGSYTYRVIARFRSWTANSAEAGPVDVTAGDTVPPKVSSIVRSGASPTNQAGVAWTVTFSEPVTGVNAGDFEIQTTGGVSLTPNPTVSGSGDTYTVSQSTGTGSGTIRLDLEDDNSIKDAALNPLAGASGPDGSFTGEVYTIDKAAPTLSALEMFDTGASRDGRIDEVKATFNEPVATSTATGPWTLTNVPSGGSLSSVATSGSVATLTLTPGAGAPDTAVGTFKVALAASASGIRDAAGNQASFAATGPADRAAPVRTLMQAFDAAPTGSSRDGKFDQVKVTFSESLASSTSTAVWAFSGAVPSNGTLSSVSTATNVATLTVAPGAGSTANTAVGTWQLALSANASTGIRDSAGNAAQFGAATPDDKAGPVPTAVSDTNGLTNGKFEATDTFTITFSEAVTNSATTSNVVLTHAGSNDTVAMPGLLQGTLSTGSKDYITSSIGTVTFASSALSQPAANQARVTLAACTPTTPCNGLTSGDGPLAVTPSTTIKDAADNTAVANSASLNFTISLF